MNESRVTSSEITSYKYLSVLSNCDTLRLSHENRAFQNLCFLAKTTTRSQFVLITYILFLTILQKRQILLKEFALIKKRYHRFLTHC